MESDVFKPERRKPVNIFNETDEFDEREAMLDAQAQRREDEGDAKREHEEYFDFERDCGARP